ncbi:hypothetical protein KO481_29360 [Nocardia sp. NEAU-G5]|uniref:ESX-1 secretion-associated protein EspA/EspE-like domain-containing protein n=1 Tax=Nocardia albiluteola TaxID=2842303 RepID=A0ABS6AWZ8_9NOCA|nr:hypothetical protein [Nocardia albiluteola]MBU3062544.1 hypothetical protein [Nocardia albiluteola]MBU3065622.1 hypothetical protein [Nocardia albiluteola]
MTFAQLMQHAQDITQKAAEMQKGEEYTDSHPVEYFKQQFAFIVPLFEPFSMMPDPANYDPLIEDLKEAMGQVDTGSVPSTQLTSDVSFSNLDLAKITNTDGGYLQGWTGTAAMAFKENFLDTFNLVAGNQFTALSTMKGVLQAHQAMWAAARDNIDKIAEATLDALDNTGGCSPSRAGFVFTVLSAVATVASAVITISTGGATAPIVPVAASAAVGNTVVSGHNSKIGGATAETIISSMQQAVADLRQHIQDVEQSQIADRVTALSAAFAQYEDKLVAVRPALAGMSPKDLGGSDGMGLPPGVG